MADGGGREYIVRPYRPGDEQGILDLFYRVFREDNPDMPPRSLAEWQQLFGDNPAGIQGFVATDLGGRIIASYASMPAFCVVAGERRLCTQIVDTAVDQDWRKSLRKKSLFVVVGREFLAYWVKPGREPYNQYIYGLPNRRAYAAGVRILGYKPVATPMQSLVREFDTAWLEHLEAEAGDVTVEALDVAAPHEAGALFERIVREHPDEVPLGTWRDAAYLSWRYRPRGGVPYRALLARRGGEAVGAAWFRHGWAGRDVTPVVDWIGRGADRPMVAALLAGVGRAAVEATPRAAAERPVWLLDTWVMPRTPWWPTLQGLGLSETPTDFNLCIIDSLPDHDFEWARAHWFFTMGDSDIY